MNINKTVWAVLFLALSLLQPLYSQAMDGNLVGAITDSTGAAIAGANLEMINGETGIKYTAVSDAQGQYRFTNVPVAKYRLTAAAPGFAGAAYQNVAIELSRTATVNIALEVSSVRTTVEVVDAAAAIDTTTANVANSFSNRQIFSVPTASTGLGVVNLSLLNAGVSSSGGVGYGTGPSIGGQRPTNNNFMIEGVDNNRRNVTGPNISVSNEAVSEFSVQQNQFSPEFGHSTGGQFNTILRSGSNEMHGSLYEYFRNRNLDAMDETDKRAGRRQNSRFDANRVGGALGGPIIKNKWFYFGNYEYNPNGLASNSSSSLVPTAEGYRLLDGIPGLRKQNLDILKQYVPAAGTQSGTRTVAVGGVAIPIGVFAVQAPSFVNIHNVASSSDYVLSDRDQLRARYLYFNQDQINAVAVPEFFTPVEDRSHVATLSEFHTFSPTLTNELRLSFSRNTNAAPVGDQQFPGLDTFPNISFQDLGINIGPGQNFPQTNRANTIQLVENVNWIRGRHSLKFGYDARKVNASAFFVQRNRGDYIYDSLDRYLRDITPTFAQRSVGGFPFVGNLLSHYLFVNDEIKLRPNLTVNLGLRYEYIGVPEGSRQQQLNSLASVPGLIEFASPKSTTKDFAPRVGIAYSPGRSGRTSIRAGFGMGYDQVYQNLGTNSLPPQFFSTVDAHVNAPGAPNFLAGGAIPGTAVPITSAAVARTRTSAYVPTLQLRPYSVQWNAGIQRVFGQDFTAEIRYLGSRGIHLPLQVNMNRLASVTPARSLPTFMQRPSQAEIDALPLSLANLTSTAPVHPLTAAGFANTITSFQPAGNSTYHGMATQFNKRFARGYQFVGAYTWSHNIDDSTAALNSTATTPRRPQDFFNLRDERSSSALDHRHRLSLTWLYDAQWFKGSGNWFQKNLIGNWTLGGTYIAETGTWMTVRSGIDSNLNGDPVADRTIINPSGDASRGSAVTPLCRGGLTGTACTAAQIVGYVAVDPGARYIQAGNGAYPNGGRNTLRGPGINNFDLSAAKRFNFTERSFFEFRGELYNALNKAQFIPGFPSVANGRSRATQAVDRLVTVGTPTFNQPNLTFQSNARTIQLVGRFQF